MKLRTILVGTAALAIGSLAIVAATRSGTTGSDATGDVPERVQVHGAASFPHERLTDWVSYANQLSVVTVTGERVRDDPSALNEAGEGYLAREVTLRIDTTLWTAPDAIPIEGSVQLLTNGFVVHDGKRIPSYIRGAPGFVLGDRYVIPLAIRDDGPSLLAPDALLALKNGKAVLATDDVHVTQALEALSGTDLDQIAVLVDSIAPDPLAVEYWHLPAYERARTVIDRKAQQDPEG